MKTSVEIRDDLWKAAKHVAIEKNVDLKTIIEWALEKYLNIKAANKGGEKK